MNTRINDYGECITAVGAPGSKVCCETQFPRLLATITDMDEQAAMSLLQTTRLSRMEKENLLQSRIKPYV